MAVDIKNVFDFPGGSYTFLVRYLGFKEMRFDEAIEGRGQMKFPMHFLSS